MEEKIQRLEMMEDSSLEVTQENLDYVNSDLKKKVQSKVKGNQALRRKIQEREENIQSLERDITLLEGRAKETAAWSQHIKEDQDLRELEVQTVKLLPKGFKKVEADEETLKQLVEELQVKLQRSVEDCDKQQKEIAKLKNHYQCLYEIYMDQTHDIKKYQEILKAMEQEKEGLLLKKERSNIQNNPSSEVVTPGSSVLETVQSNVKKNGVKNKKSMFWLRFFRSLFFMIMAFMRKLIYVFFYLTYINPDCLVVILPMLMSRSTLKWLSDILSPYLTVEVEGFLPY